MSFICLIPSEKIVRLATDRGAPHEKQLHDVEVIAVRCHDDGRRVGAEARPVAVRLVHPAHVPQVQPVVPETVLVS